MKDYKELSRQEFNREAEKFDNASVTDVYSMCKNSYEPILNEVKEETFETLLDVGCGTGNSIERLCKDLPNKKYVGIDLAEKMVEIAQKKEIKNSRFVVGDAEKLPFSDNQFDVIICKESFHHYPNVEKFFQSAYRVLKPGGRLIILDMTCPAPLRWLYNHVLLKCINKGDVHVYNMREMEKLYADAGFSLEKKRREKEFRFVTVGRKAA